MTFISIIFHFAAAAAPQTYFTKIFGMTMTIRTVPPQVKPNNIDQFEQERTETVSKYVYEYEGVSIIS